MTFSLHIMQTKRGQTKDNSFANTLKFKNSNQKNSMKGNYFPTGGKEITIGWLNCIYTTNRGDFVQKI